MMGSSGGGSCLVLFAGCLCSVVGWGWLGAWNVRGLVAGWVSDTLLGFEGSHSFVASLGAGHGFLRLCGWVWVWLGVLGGWVG